jgi:hypothetical protein
MSAARRGKSWTEKQRLAITASFQRPEVKAKMRAWSRKPVSAETRAKLSIATKNNLTPEHRDKMLAALQNPAVQARIAIRRQSPEYKANFKILMAAGRLKKAERELKELLGER